ncbi:hypothetical protein BDM02DRAFT_1367043 [Thelephora ganbajun]|uniref:Uncharacterized protein n=1 Tax=Thelephora ganbajun TaxID=370292 RepID=A0ACB6Z3H7_THEGA|nr:hypothetical protein BDM02DRAFT_1367043 [Thelephora ganbajun]
MKGSARKKSSPSLTRFSLPSEMKSTRSFAYQLLLFWSCRFVAHSREGLRWPWLLDQARRSRERAINEVSPDGLSFADHHKTPYLPSPSPDISRSLYALSTCSFVSVRALARGTELNAAY